MKIKRINKIWKLSFVGLVAAIGCNLTSCGNHKENAKIKHLQQTINNYYSTRSQIINDWNYSNSRGENRTDTNMFYISLNYDDTYKPDVDVISQWVKDNQISDYDASLVWEVAGYYHLTGNAEKDYDYVRSQPILLFNKFKTEYNALLTNFQNMQYFENGYFYESFQIMFTFNLFAPNSSKSICETNFYTSYLFYDFKNKKMIDDKTKIDYLNISKMQHYEKVN